MVSFLNNKEIKVHDFLTLKIPTLREYRSNDNNGQFRTNVEALINLFIMTPANRMVDYYDEGVDYNTIDEYDFFLQMFYSLFIYSQSHSDLTTVDSTCLFNVNFSNCLLAENKVTKELYIIDQQGNTLINRYYYKYISLLICEIFSRERFVKKAKNEEATRYFVELERKRIKRLQRKNKKNFMQLNLLDEKIIALVNNRDFKYDYETVNDLTFYDFMVSYKQITKNWKVDNIMSGAYCGFGTVDLNKFTSAELNRFSFKDK